MFAYSGHTSPDLSPAQAQRLQSTSTNVCSFLRSGHGRCLGQCGFFHTICLVHAIECPYDTIDDKSDAILHRCDHCKLQVLFVVEMWVTESYLYKDFSEELQPSDWQSFCKHANRVQYFEDKASTTFDSPCESVHYHLTSNALEILVSFLREHRCLFTRLEALQIEAEDSLPKYLPYLSQGTLQSLEFHSLGTMERSYPEVYADWSEIMPLVHSAWPNLRSIKIEAGLRVQVNPYIHILARWVKDLSRLQVFDAEVVQHPLLLSALSDLPLLHTLKFGRSFRHNSESHSQMFSGTKSLSLSSSCFPSLRTLDMHESISDFVLGSPKSLLRVFDHSQMLTHLNITFYVTTNMSQPSPDSFVIFEIISHISLLRSLHITLPTSEGPDVDNVDHNKLVLSGKLLSLLFPLRYLQELELDARGERLAFFDELDVTIEDQDLRNAAFAWPNLQVFKLMRSRSRTPPRITLVGIQALYNRCPYLWRVTMHINSNLPTVVRSGRIRLDLPPPDDKRRRVYFAYLRLTVTLPQEEEAGWDWLDSAHRISIATRLMFPQLYSLMADRQPHVDGRWGQEVSRMWRVCKRSTTEKVRSWLV